MFEAKDTKLCRGCLSTDRKLTSITAGDLMLYYTLLADDRKPDALTTPGIDLCWECKGVLRRARMFRAQVQRAHTILEEMLGLPPEKAKLSSLTIQHKSKYDAIFEETEPNDQPLFFKPQVFDVTFDKIVIPTKYKALVTEKDEKILKDTSLLTSNSNPTKLDYNSDSEIEDSDHYENLNTNDRDSSSPEPELTIRRITPQKISEDVKIFKRTNLNNEKSKTKPGPQYKVIRTNRVVTNNVKLAPIIKTPVIAKLELELQKFMQNAKKNVTAVQETPKQKKPKRKSTEENTPKQKKPKKDSTERKTRNAGSSMDKTEFKDDSDRDDSESSADESSELEASASKRDREKYKAKKPESDPDFSAEDEESDSETERKDRKVQEENLDENGKIKPPKRYKRAINTYKDINDALSCFTEIEMSVDDIKSILEKEDAIVDEKRPIKCSVCGHHFKLQRHLCHHALRNHRKSHPQHFRKGGYYNPPPTMPEEPYLCRCNVCSKLLRRAHVLAHMNENHRTRYFCNGDGCEWSTKIFWIKLELVEHWNEIHKQFFCDTCGVRKRTKSRLEYHVQKAHLNLRPVQPQQCPHCTRSYVHASILQKHIQRRHLEPEPAELRYCVECDITYPTISRLQIHFHNKHSEAAQRKYPCTECGRVLANKTSLKNHYAFFHTGQTEYRCHICGKYFSKRAGVTNHVNSTHFNLKQPKTKPCHVCGRLFGANRTLRQHMYTHTGERPYKCEHCDAAYTQPFCLRTHLAKHHGIHQAVRVVPLNE